MATPIQNYTDPVGLSCTTPVSLNIPMIYNRITLDGAYKQLMLTMSKPGYIGDLYLNCTVYPVMSGLGIQMKSIPCKTPKPPVGKMLINTFPPIYKERINVIGLPDCPRVYPPILFRKIG